jgi:hypothetical protein
MKNTQDTIGRKADIYGGKVNILGFVLRVATGQRVDLHKHLLV